MDGVLIVEKAKQYAVECHRSTNHLYGGDKPYEFHLQMVFDYAKKYAHLIPENQRNDFLAAAWVHDVIEDCRQTYNDVLSATNKEVAELAYALTNEKGKNRKERANDKYYEGIRNYPGASLLKVCDRLANFQHSINEGSRMAGMYAKENDMFVHMVDNGSCEEAIKELLSLSAYEQKK